MRRDFNYEPLTPTAFLHRSANVFPDRVGVARQALDLGQAERARHRHLVLSDLRRIRTTFRPLPGRKVETFRGATRIRRPVGRVPRSLPTDRSVDRCCRDIAGALRRSLLGPPARPFGPEAPGSIRHRPRTGFHQPPALCAEGSTGTRPVHRPSSVRTRSIGRAARTLSSARPAAAEIEPVSEAIISRRRRWCCPRRRQGRSRSAHR